MSHSLSTLLERLADWLAAPRPFPKPAPARARAASGRRSALTRS